MPVQPMLLHRMALVSFRLFCKNLGNLQEFFGQMVYRPPWPTIARTPMTEPKAIAFDIPFKTALMMVFLLPEMFLYNYLIYSS